MFKSLFRNRSIQILGIYISPKESIGINVLCLLVFQIEIPNMQYLSLKSFLINGNYFGQTRRIIKMTKMRRQSVLRNHSEIHWLQWFMVGWKKIYCNCLNLKHWENYMWGIWSLRYCKETLVSLVMEGMNMNMIIWISLRYRICL